MLPRGPSALPIWTESTRRMVAQVRQAVDHHSRVPAALIQQRAALRTVAQAAWIEARRKSDFSTFRAASRKDRRAGRANMRIASAGASIPTTPWCRSTNRVKQPRAFGACSKRCGPDCGLFSTTRAPAPSRVRIFSIATFPRRINVRSASAWRPHLVMTFRAGGSIPRFIHSRSRSRATTCVSRRVTRPNYLPASIFGTAHETGHGLYEQGVDPAYTRSVFATDLIGLYAVGGTSFGAHESQSRLWENHVVRSPGFWQLHFGELQARFPGHWAT